MFRKKLILMGAVGGMLVIADVCYSEVIYVSGDVSGTWSADSVIVTGNVFVPYYQLLIIEPGVKVLFQGDWKFTVQHDATLLAIGTETDSILFDRLLPSTDWNSIKLEYNTDSSRFEYCHITHSAVYGTGSSGQGGGIYCDNSSPAIQHCLIDSCSANNYGGGIYCNDSYGIINLNRITGNSASAGGGIYCHVSSPLISNNLINGNAGDGIVCEGNSNPLISYNSITDNEGNAGGIYIDNFSNPTIYYNNISRNSDSGIQAGGVNPTYTYNNTICNNSGYGGVTGSLIIVNSIMWENIPDQISPYANVEVTYSDVQYGWPGTGNIELDPMFVNPVSGDYHLQWGSPCIDAGDPNFPFDPDSTIADMGAFYYNQSIPAVGKDQKLNVPKQFRLLPNFPNPFNPTTTIRFDLPATGWVKLEVFDVAGRVVGARSPCPYMEGWREAGMHEVSFDGSGLASGVYLVYLKAGDFSQIQKMVLVK